MNGDTDNNKQRINVISVGNAWVICDSKSRQGFKYYFNTVSGQSVWNLSPEEIEKAKKFTKGLPISEIEKCPEPAMDPPMNPNNNHTQPGPSQNNNERFVRQMSNQMSNIFPMGFLNGNNLPGIAGMPVTGLPGMPGVSGIPGMPGIQGLNPIIWGNPPNNSAMPPTPVIYVAYPQMNFQQPQEYAQNQAHYNEQDNNRKMFSNTRDVDNDMFSRSRLDMRGQNRFVERDMTSTNTWNSNNSDLRQKLRRKRSLSLSSETKVYNHRDDGQIGHREDFFEINKNVAISSSSNQIDIEESPSKYDISVLDQLKPIHSRAKHWFIVVDTEILLHNFSFLNKVTNPDHDCYLMVPHHVMQELRHLVTFKGDIQIRRILRFLSQQIEAELAFEGEEMRTGNDNDETYKVLATCEDLADKHNVILLSNDEAYQRYKNSNTNIHILTLNDLKEILNERAPMRPKSPTLDIKIVVPNTYRDKIVSPTQIKRPESPRSVPSKIKDPIQSQTVKITRPTRAAEIQKKICSQTKSPEKAINEEETLNTVPAPLANKETRGSLNNVERVEENTSNNDSKKSAPVRLYRWRKSRNKNVSSKQTISSESAKSNQQEPTEPIAVTAEINIECTSKPSSRAPSTCSSIQRDHIDDGRPNIVIDETSTSGVASNNTLDSEVNRVEVKRTVSVCDDVEFEMFVVGGQSMEEVLRTRREEWVLRFIQIMEETLKEILRVDSPFQSKCYAYNPAWAADLPELARCIIKKFSDHFSVVDAANRLSFKLQKISDTQGANIEPKQYMEMYSFGVYLIKSLKNVTEDCEDLNTADESLKKLLYDIQNDNLESGHGDTFADELTDSAIQTETLNSEKEMLHEFPKETDKREINTRSKSNVLSPHKEDKTQIQNKPKKQTKSESNFFSSLSLVKKTKTDKPSLAIELQNLDTPNTLRVSLTPPHVSPQKSLPKSPILTLSRKESNKDSSKRNSDINTNTEETTSPIRTCFIRNFNSIPQFEEKLNNQQEPDENLAQEDYNYDDEYYDNEYYCEDEVENGEIEHHYESPRETETVHDEGETRNNNEKFEWFIKEFTDEIRRTIKIVLTLCTKCCGELKNSNEPSEQMQEEMRTARESITSIKNALTSILVRDSTSSENNITNLLKMANLDDFIPNNELLLEYTDIISKCSEQVNFCYEKITQIMQVAGI